MKTLLDHTGIEAALRKLADAIAASVPAACGVGVIGIRARGDDLARRLLPLLQQRRLPDIAFGSLDITLYRDDLHEIGPSAVVRTTEIDFDVSGLYIILVDDVIFTGRSIRSALDAIIDLGRPRAIRLAVLVDRPGRELPIQPDFAAVRLDDERGSVRVLLAETDGVDRVEVES
jgi:pyrimidine operon attenuation protein/uracil phosphoribosyltransferase